MRSVAAFLVVLGSVGLIGCKPSSSCPRGQFLLRKQQCVLCHPTCSECDGQELFQCTTCGVGQVQDPDTGECIDCEMGCKTCSTEDPEICNSCAEGYFLFRHQCRRHCPQSTYEDWGRGLCLPCPAPCTDCRGNARCLACQPGYFLN
uniref:R-spondin Fu-CRD domain-containing protein n=1 Tax=Gasterosteus aculeatus aculeatus TaxID=481459 RepID=A0AAQ4QMA6_GASAC